jgi:DNA-binding PadR family transcriptional regulator
MAWDPEEGNYLRRARKTYSISERGRTLIHKLSMELAVNHSAVIELGLRRLAIETWGKVDPAKPVD